MGALINEMAFSHRIGSLKYIFLNGNVYIQVGIIFGKI